MSKARHDGIPPQPRRSGWRVWLLVATLWAGPLHAFTWDIPGGVQINFTAAMFMPAPAPAPAPAQPSAVANPAPAPLYTDSGAPTVSDHIDNSYTVHFTGGLFNTLESSYNDGPYSELQAGFVIADGAFVEQHSRHFAAQPPGSYRYRVKTVSWCFFGCTGSATRYSPERLVMVTPPLALPAPPSAIAVPSALQDRGSGVSAALSWPAGDSSAAALEYQLQRRNSASWQSLYSGSTAAYTDTGLRAEGAVSTVSYRVRACNRRGCSPYSSTATVVISDASGPASGIKTPPAARIAQLAEQVTDSELRATAVAGLTSGAFRVSESGSASYSVPILAAAGTAGVAPQLSLNYSSSGGNGLVGIGWQLNGISSIARCRQTLHQDGVSLPISGSQQDRFCLDGQRLIAVGEGAYGAVGAHYQTEFSQHARITSLGGTPGHPNAFKVERKDGSVSYYGAAPGSSDSDAQQQLGDGSTTLVWAIKQFSDSVGNPIWYHYHNDSHGHRISEVRYAYGDRPGPAGHGAAISFSYTTPDSDNPRLDPIYGYLAGQPLVTRARLNTITSSSANQQLRHYRLSYAGAELGAGSAHLAQSAAAQASTAAPAPSAYGRFGGWAGLNWGGSLYPNSVPSDNPLSRLIAITECVDQLCRQPLQFGWGEPALGESRGAEINHSLNRLLSWKPADINGDGILDLIYSIHRRSGDDQSVHYLISDGDKLRRGVFKSPGRASGELYYHEDPGAQTLELEAFDYNADGRSDLAVWAARANGGRGAWQLYLSTVQADGSWALSAVPIALPMTDKETAFADVNGDGLVDAIGKDQLYLLKHDATQPVSSNRYYQFAATPGVSFPWAHGTKFSYVDSWQARSTQIKGIVQQAGDFDGDGRADLVVETQQLGTFCWYGCPAPSAGLAVVINRGEEESGKTSYDLFPSPLSASGFSSQHRSLSGLVKPLDLNNDGLSDLVYFQGGRWRWALSDGQQLIEQGELTDSYSQTAHTAQQNAIHQAVQLVDVNRDGYADFVWHDYPSRAQKVLLWNIAAQAFEQSQPYRLRGTTGNKNHSYNYLDYSGDGIPDLVYSNGSRLLFYPGNGGEQAANKITTIRNALGAQTRISYRPLGSSGHYQPLAFDTQALPSTNCSTLPFGGQFCLPGGTLNVVTPASIQAFYTAINGDWVLPPGHATLGRDINGDGERDPVLLLNGSMPVVTEVSSSAPSADPSQPGHVDHTATSTISYHYREAKIQAMGRGFLGFAALTTVDHQSGVRTTTRYRQDFPFIGQPLTTETTTASGERLSMALNHWRVNGWVEQGDGRAHHRERHYAIELAGSEETQYLTRSEAGRLTVSDQPLTQQATTNRYDSHGNLTNSEVVTRAGPAASGEVIEQRVTTHNHYAAAGFSAAESQRLGRLSATTVQRQRLHRDGSRDSAERRSAFSYYSSGRWRGLLQSETVEPNQPAYRQQISHHYDSFGNLVSRQTSGYADADQRHHQTRYSRVEYDRDGRYIDRRYALFTPSASAGPQQRLTEQVTARNRYGAQQRSVSYTGNGQVETLNHYSAFGDHVFTADAIGRYTVALTSRAATSHCPAGTAFHTISRGSAQGSHGQQLSCFDALARTVRTATTGFDGRWIYRDTEYDHAGRTQRHSEPYFQGAGQGDRSSCASTANVQCWSQLHYDPLGQLWQREDSRGNVTTTAYHGQHTINTNALGQQQHQYSNLLGELSAVVDALGSRIDYRYNAQGQLIATTDSGGHTTTVRYDLVGRKIALDDPDKGLWHYRYNSFGELIEQRAANGSHSRQRWDVAGRLVERIDTLPASLGGQVDAHTVWHYDSASHGLGQLAAVEERISGYLKLPQYDALGRLTTTVTSLGTAGELGDHYEHRSYGPYGRVMQQFDAARSEQAFTDNGVEHHYNRYGYLAQVSSADYRDGVPVVRYQTIEAMDARGNVIAEQLGNGVNRHYRYAANNGLLLAIEADNGTATLQRLSMSWDALGNLNQRRDDADTPLLEQFSYDRLNRLSSYRVNDGAEQQLRYDLLGNISHKTGVGDYRYGRGMTASGGAGPHAVTQAGATHYRYDANGNNTAGAGRTLRYTSYDKLQQVSRGNHTVTFAYGPDRQRFLRRDHNSASGATTQTLYIGSVEKITHPDQSQTWKRSLGDLLITEQRSRSGARLSSSLHAQLKDHLGSVVAITNRRGQLQQRLAFDPWGVRRNASNWQRLSAAELVAQHSRNAANSHSPAALLETLTPLPAHLTSRGFTGHEMVDEVGIIHMNGRIYDAELGRFLQADPFIDGVTHTQGYNRYAYGKNNPLNGTDPSGFGFFKELFDDILGITESPLLNAVAQIAACYYGGPAGCAEYALMSARGHGGSWGDAFKAAATAYVSASVFEAIGQSTQFGFAMGDGVKQLAMNALANGTAGGVMSVLQGGKFGHGFAAAGLSSLAKPALRGVAFTGTSGLPLRVLTRAVIGGTLSELTGGKFANGAVTAAFASAMSEMVAANDGRYSDEGGEASQILDVESGGVCVDLVCRPTWKVANHCATIVAECGATNASQIEAQFSLRGFETEFEPQGSTNSTFTTDRAAFLNPDERNLRYSIAPPVGMSSRQFADSVIQYGNSYQAPRYGLILGPNSNSAAAFPLYRSGARVPAVPRAPALNYWRP